MQKTGTPTRPPLTNEQTPARGRLIRIDQDQATLRDWTGESTVRFDPSASEPVRAGDVVEISGGRARVLTPNRTERRTIEWSDRVLNPRRLHATRKRLEVESGIREFFLSRGFLETRTPLLVPCPGMEPHIRPFQVTPWAREEGLPEAGLNQDGARRRAYLPTSPEFAMKRLLVGGLEKIFQICPAFRDEPCSVTHHPEFTMLEWYRSYAGYEDIMRDTEEMFDFLARKIFGKPVIRFQGQEISVAAPWPRLRVRDLFQELVGIDLVQCSSAEAMARECARLGLPADLSRENWDDLYFKIWLNHIEPKLPADRAVFVTRYPASQAALAVIDSDPDGSRWARRFECYAAGLELGNAFEELTDPVEQRKRFEKDMALREEIYGPDFPKNPLDEGFLHALTEGMPPAGGIAMGVDRIVMLFADEPEIDYTTWLGSDLG